MNEIDKLRVLLPHWIEHNEEHAKEFRGWAERTGLARNALLDAARLLEEASARLYKGLEELGGSLVHHHVQKEAPAALSWRLGDIRQRWDFPEKRQKD
jgi:hypothetical protein